VQGIDTHKELHVAAVVDVTGEVLATQAFATTRGGYGALIRWMRGFGQLEKVGVEPTASYGPASFATSPRPGSWCSSH
jgi:transposase